MLISSFIQNNKMLRIFNFFAKITVNFLLFFQPAFVDCYTGKTRQFERAVSTRSQLRPTMMSTGLIAGFLLLLKCQGCRKVWFMPCHPSASNILFSHWQSRTSTKSEAASWLACEGPIDLTRVHNPTAPHQTSSIHRSMITTIPSILVTCASANKLVSAYMQRGSEGFSKWLK